METMSSIQSPNHLLSHYKFWDQKNISFLFSLLIFLSLIIRFLSIGVHDLLVEEAYYWNYSQHLDFGYLDHPPMVALLIKATTLIFGINEFAVRLPALICWIIATLFSFKLTELIHPGSGINSVLLLSLLPFHMAQSTIITPDQPVLVCWSALIYYFYRIFFFNHSKSWYQIGIWLGLGMLSKYTIVLLGPAALFYLITVPSARYWFIRKEPYLAVLIALCIFSPVIYWNAIHEWASFIFQSTRRFQLVYNFAFHHFMGLLLLFLLPNGVVGLYLLLSKKCIPIDKNIRWFFLVFTLLPLSFFGTYSFTHFIKIDWIGPGLISIIPWLAFMISKNNKFAKTWLWTLLFLLPCYLLLLGSIAFGISDHASQLIFRKYISWNNLAKQVHDVLKNEAQARNTTPIIVPLDLYNIGSELAFYQAKLFQQGKIKEIYPVIGRHIFGGNSLMYQYWSKEMMISGKTLLLITTHPENFDWPVIKNQSILTSPKKIWSYSQGNNVPIQPYYYEFVQIK
jgi:4-amino-4-deoxy-L-arabinose transferase-like glycosyltransferase